MRKKFIAANWKMNNGIFETEKFIKSFSVNSDENIDILICAPFIFGIELGQGQVVQGCCGLVGLCHQLMILLPFLFIIVFSTPTPLSIGFIINRLLKSCKHYHYIPFTL